MTDVLHGVEDDVRFDTGVSSALIGFCRSTAQTISGQRGLRNSAEQTGSRVFQGYFSGLFTDNAATARADGLELVDRLEEIADHAEHLQACAEAEQRRRETARAWIQEREDRNWFEDRWADLTESEEDATPPVGPPDPEPSMVTHPPRTGVRTTPPPGAGGGGTGGTSSASPADLQSFATSNANINSTLSAKPSTLRHRLEDFAASCRWGRLEAAGVVSGFTAWNEANEQDVTWARTVADAFERAGGEGGVVTLSDAALFAALNAAGVDVSRDDLTIEPAQAFGAPPTTGYAMDPVNTATGNFLETEVDLTFPGSASVVRLERTYNSFDRGTGAFGPGWTSWPEAGLSLDDEAARATHPDGRTLVFPRLGDGWGHADGEDQTLERTGTGWRVSDPAGTGWTYDAAGRLTSVGRGTAATTVHLRWHEGRLVRLEHGRGRHLDLEWDLEAERVVAVVAGDGRRVDYAYAEGRLVGATGPRGTRRYGWDEAGLLGTVTDADGVVEVDNTYDERGRVTRQRSPHGRLVRFAYLPGRVTAVSDVDGTRSDTWIHDTRGRLVGVVDAHGHRQSMSYDARGHLVMVLERDGSATVHEHDARGRRARTVTPEGADITVGYDDQDRVTTVAAAAGVTSYSYAEGLLPVEMVDPEGGRTRLTWDDGLLTGYVDPTGVAVRMTYDAAGDLVAATDAAGATARVERDAVGRVVASVTPEGHRTETTWADSGLPVSRRDPDGGLWRFEHTAAGRLSAVVDPLGARTTIEQGPHGADVRTVDPLGRALTRTLDELGNLSAAELPGGATWRYTHDALSRLVEVTDPSGARWSYDHDVTGAVRAAVDPTGRRRTVEIDRTAGTVAVDDGLVGLSAGVDSLGRLTSRTGPDGSSAVVTHDRCGRVRESLDAEGNLTRIERDAAGRVVGVVGPTGATTRVEHDVCGRVSAVVDPTGARTTREYDADGRLVRQTLPTGEVARAAYDACGRLVLLERPGAGVARYAWDLAGRLVESSDTSYGHRRFRYDAAGQLVAVTDGVGGVTRYEYDPAGRCVSTTDPAGGTTRRTFDAMGRVTALTDPLGRTSRIGYDAAGRTTEETDPAGVRSTWDHDASGRWSERRVDGVLRAQLSLDVRARVLTVTDHAGPGEPVRHELEYDRRHLLVRRSRGDRAMSWTYDAAGLRTSSTAPDGTVTRWTHDVAGRLRSVEHPLLGRVELERDAAGRLVRSVAGGVEQTWTHRDGWVVAHTTDGPEGPRRSEVERDETGRILAWVHDGVRTTLEHDAALRLSAAHRDGATTRWRYAEGGRLVAESVVDAQGRREVEHVRDLAGQLLETREQGRVVLEHAYDSRGRRTRSASADGGLRELTWSPEGRLASVVDRDGDGVTRRTDLHVDPLGELALVDGVELWWDSASRLPALAQVGDRAVLTAGAATAAGGRWLTPGWRGVRDAAPGDPWTPADAAPLDPVADLRVAASGGLLVAGLEWMGARAYDPASRGFLSTDPLPPVAGSGAAGDPYAFAGQDPLHRLDPLGLRPATDADLQAYAQANAGALAGAIQWVDENTDYIVGGLVTAAGVAAFFLPIPGAQILGGVLMGAGVNVIQQRMEAGRDGQIDLVQVGIAAGFGAIGGAGTGLALRAGVQGMVRATAVGGAGMGAAEGLVSGSYDYLTGPGPHTPGGFATSVGLDTVSNAAVGAAMGPIQLRIDETAMFQVLPQVRDTPDLGIDDQAQALMNAPGDLPVIGSPVDTQVAAPWDGHVPLGDGPVANSAVQQAIDYQRPVYLASEPGSTSPEQMQTLLDAGYSRQGDYMMPGGG